MKQNEFIVKLIRDNNVIDTKSVYEFIDDCVGYNLFASAMYVFEDTIRVNDIIMLDYCGKNEYIQVQQDKSGVVIPYYM